MKKANRFEMLIKEKQMGYRISNNISTAALETTLIQHPGYSKEIFRDEQSEILENTCNQKTDEINQ